MKWLPKQLNRGYTLLFSVLISSLLLAIGLAILNISTKEVALSSAARESEIAFYAADAGAECAFRWDLAGKFTIPLPQPAVPPYPTGQMTCGDTPTETQTFDPKADPPNQPKWTVKFVANNAPQKDPCFEVTVMKQYSDASGTTLKTKIESRGYNTCDTTNPRRVERAIKIEY